MLAMTGDDVPGDAVLDSGPRARAGLSMRRCALTRAELPTTDMIRFVLDPQGRVLADVKKKLPGRGLWLTASGQTVRSAIKKGVFARGFGAKAVVSPDLEAQTDTLLAQSALDALAIAGKASAVICGFAKCENALGSGKVIALIHASDASADGTRKLGQAARAAGFAEGEPAAIECFTSAQLDLALARPNVVHAAVLDTPAGEAFIARCQRLADYRSGMRTGSPAPVSGSDFVARPERAASKTEQD